MPQIISTMGFASYLKCNGEVHPAAQEDTKLDVGFYGLVSFSPHFFLLPFLPVAHRAASPGLRSHTRTLSLSLWELLHAPEGISHRMPAFLLLVDNIFFKLALGSFEGNPDIVRKRVRGQMGKKKNKKKREVCFFLSLL